MSNTLLYQVIRKQVLIVHRYGQLHRSLDEKQVVDAILDAVIAALPEVDKGKIDLRKYDGGIGEPRAAGRVYGEISYQNQVKALLQSAKGGTE